MTNPQIHIPSLSIKIKSSEIAAQVNPFLPIVEEEEMQQLILEQNCFTHLPLKLTRYETFLSIEPKMHF